MIGRSPHLAQFVGSGEAVLVDDSPALANRDVLADLEARHGQAMFGFVRRLGLSDEESRDCVQEGFLRLWSELERGVPPDGDAVRRVAFLGVCRALNGREERCHPASKPMLVHRDAIDGAICPGASIEHPAGMTALPAVLC
jgi:hypothetical protein